MKFYVTVCVDIDTDDTWEGHEAALAAARNLPRDIEPAAKITSLSVGLLEDD